jgi:hypothetical protein
MLNIPILYSNNNNNNNNNNFLEHTNTGRKLSNVLNGQS